MTAEELALTRKYTGEYSSYCNNRECGDTCPVFVQHLRTPEISCFMIFCHMRESGEIKDVEEAL